MKKMLHIKNLFFTLIIVFSYNAKSIACDVNASQTLTICANDTVWVGQIAHNLTGMYTDTLFGVAVGGCDSIVMTDLTVLPVATGLQSFTFCDGDSAVVGMSVYKTTGVYTDVFIAANGCDSTVTSTVKVNTVIVAQTIQLCVGGSIIVGNVTHNATGMYSDTLATAFGCDSIVNTDLIIDPAVNVNTTKADSTRTIFADTTQNGIITYQWYNCTGNVLLPNETKYFYVAAANGSYKVTVTVNGCSATSACKTINTVGLGEEELSKGVQVYPNPANDMITITSSSIKKMSIVNMLGKVVMEQNIQGTSTIDISKLSSGIYFIRTNDGYTTKLVKQ